ncbi:MAG: hypothetical protein JWM90_1013 [Thermoleophilia bacterium]|nr:hypothetical protein [Thermoleophilia bacterium]
MVQWTLMYHVTPAHSAPAVEAPIRTAALHQQPRRSDGAREFTIAVTVLCLLLAATLAFVRGTPPKPAAPVASAPAASAPAVSAPAASTPAAATPNA